MRRSGPIFTIKGLHVFIDDMTRLDDFFLQTPWQQRKSRMTL